MTVGDYLLSIIAEPVLDKQFVSNNRDLSMPRPRDQANIDMCVQRILAVYLPFS